MAIILTLNCVVNMAVTRKEIIFLWDVPGVNLNR